LLLLRKQYFLLRYQLLQGYYILCELSSVLKSYLMPLLSAIDGLPTLLIAQEA
jgi:hypothetical protein